MNLKNQCAECRGDIVEDALFGLCQKCLLDLAADSSKELPALRRKKSRPFGEYELSNQIGRGGMGVVYAAMQVPLRRPVALKMILESQLETPSVRKRFLIEAEAAAKLDHPNIVPIYEVGEHEGQPFISMKLIQGESLRDQITRGDYGHAARAGDGARGNLRDRQMKAARLIATVAWAVQHAHDHGVLHRDLKPGNIIVDAEGQPHLTDFGLAKIMDRGSGISSPSALTMDGIAMGTPSYMSPEQANGKPISPVSDVYSLGTVLYEMLTGQPPFKGATSLETIRAVTNEAVKRPSALLPRFDRDLETICLKCLEKDPTARYHSARHLAEDLERWLRQEPILARPTGPAKRLVRWCRRNKLAAGLIVSLCVGLGTAIILLEVAEQQRRTLELVRAQQQQEFAKQIDDLWIDPDNAGVLIPSYQLRAIGGLPPRAPLPGELRLIFSVKVLQYPLGQARNYAPFLAMVEQKMGEILKRPVAFDVYFFKLTFGPSHPIVSGTADFERMGALSYILAKEAWPEIDLLAQEKTKREAVIFARKELGITSLQGIKGQRVAFAHTNSTISFLAKVQLAKAGIYADSLILYTNLPYKDPLSIGVARDHSSPLPPDARDLDGEGMAHKEVTQQVLKGSFDVGEVQRHFFETYKFKGRGLNEICTYPVPPNVYVARSRLSPQVTEAFQKALMSLTSKREKEILEALQASRIEGFSSVQDSDFNTLRGEFKTWLPKFENKASTAASRK